MRLFARPLTIATAIACLSLGACREDSSEESASNHMTAPTEATQEEAESLQQEITDLKRSIETHEQNIEDLNAVVTMERDKVDENPDYESPILQETLHEQEQERLEIKKAQQQLETLTR